MSPIRVNFTGVRTDGFEPFPVGEPLHFTIYNIKEAKSKAGNDKLTFEFKAVEGNRRAWRDFSLMPTALWGLKRLLVELGVSAEDLEGEFDFDPNDILGREVILTFGPERPIPGSTKMGQDIDEITAAD
jgi:hypothetical protein